MLPHSRTVVIGAPAGGFDAVRAVLGGLRPPAPPRLLAVTYTPCGGATSEAGVSRSRG